MPFITINITGLNEATRGLSEIIQNAPQTNKTILEEATDLFERTAKSKVHVVTGRTKNSTKKLMVTNQFGVIESRFGAKWEERREGSKGGQGPHKFLTESSEVVKREMPVIIQKHYDQLIKRVQSTN